MCHVLSSYVSIYYSFVAPLLFSNLFPHFKPRSEIKIHKLIDNTYFHHIFSLLYCCSSPFIHFVLSFHKHLILNYRYHAITYSITIGKSSNDFWVFNISNASRPQLQHQINVTQHQWKLRWLLRRFRRVLSGNGAQESIQVQQRYTSWIGED